MKKMNKPLFLLFTFLFLSTMACALSSVSPELTEQSTDAIVQEAVATAVAGVQSTPPAADPLPANNAAAASPDLQNAFINVYKQANPAVVQIFTYKKGSEFNDLLGTGSGFVIDMDGHIVTNNHVVTDGDVFEVSFASGERLKAVVIGTDVDSDLAVIKVDSLPADITPLVLGDSGALDIGQFVIAIGNPFGEESSMSIGIVSGLGRTIASERVADGGGVYSLPQVIQTDAAINPGNSGGPLLNLQGQVVGVNSAILSASGTNSGVGFSIPVNAVKRIAPSLIESGSYVYPYIGIRMASLDISAQEHLGLSQNAGAYITDVAAGTPAERAGLIGKEEAGGDLIIRIDGVPVNDADDLISYLVFETTVGQTVNITVLRDNEEIVLPLVLGERP